MVGIRPCELLMATRLCFVILNVAAANSVKGYQYYYLAIGFASIALAHGGGHISAGCCEPAVICGIAPLNLGSAFSGGRPTASPNFR